MQAPSACRQMLSVVEANRNRGSRSGALDLPHECDRCEQVGAAPTSDGPPLISAHHTVVDDIYCQADTQKRLPRNIENGPCTGWMRGRSRLRGRRSCLGYRSPLSRIRAIAEFESFFDPRTLSTATRLAIRPGNLIRRTTDF